MDDELFTLCKQVYEKTSWSDTDMYFLGNDIIHRVPRQSDLHPPTLTQDDCSPIYTSDYLLDRLPSEIDLTKLVVTNDDRSHAGYARRDDHGCWVLDTFYYDYASYSSTPLKALLKLTINLADAGKLNSQLPQPNKEETK